MNAGAEDEPGAEARGGRGCRGRRTTARPRPGRGSTAQPKGSKASPARSPETTAMAPRRTVLTCPAGLPTWSPRSWVGPTYLGRTRMRPGTLRTDGARAGCASHLPLSTGRRAYPAFQPRRPTVGAGRPRPPSIVDPDRGLAATSRAVVDRGLLGGQGQTLPILGAVVKPRHDLRLCSKSAGQRSGPGHLVATTNSSGTACRLRHAGPGPPRRRSRWWRRAAPPAAPPPTRRGRDVRGPRPRA